MDRSDRRSALGNRTHERGYHKHGLPEKQGPPSAAFVFMLLVGDAKPVLAP